MDWLDRSVGPLRVRAWGLIGNFLANALALYGLAGYLRSGEGAGAMAAGAGLTLLFILLLATPSR